MEGPNKTTRATAGTELPNGRSTAREVWGEDYGARRKWLARLFALLWLLFLVYPFSAVLGSQLAPTPLAVSLSGLALFVGIYAWLMFGYEPPWREAGVAKVNRNWVAVAGLLALAVAYDFAYGPEAFFGLFVYVSVASGMTLPARGAAMMITCSILLAAVSGWSSGAKLLDLVQIVLLVGGIGLSTIWWSTLVARNIQLRRARKEVARLAVAEERLRFARDLHDLLGHSLSLITLKTDVISRLLPDDPDRAAAEARDAEAVAREALKEVRAAVLGYRRPSLPAELAAAREVLAAAGVSCRIEDGGVRPSAAAGEALAWAVREGVTNVVRHSGARWCGIRLEQHDGGISLEVTDDGRGAGGKPEAGGSGLAGLKERVSAAGGALEAGPEAGGGFRLRVTLPSGADEDGVQVAEESPVGERGA